MRILIPTLLFLASCGTFPQLEDTLSAEARNAAIPQLSPVPSVPAQSGDDGTLLAQRIAALEARASAIRQSDNGALQ